MSESFFYIIGAQHRMYVDFACKVNKWIAETFNSGINNEI